MTEVAAPAERRTGLAFVIFVAALAVFARLELGSPSYGDLSWQIPEGLQILAGHFPNSVPYAIEANAWLDHEWLFEAVCAAFFAHGAYPAFAVLCITAFVGFPILLYTRLRAERGDAAATVVALLAAEAIFFTNPYRPQTFAYYFFTLVAFELRAARPNAARVFAYTVVWANLHASVILAPVLGVLYLAGAWKERVPKPRLRALAIALVAAAAGTLVTPFGIKLWIYAMQFADAPFGQYIREWRPLDFSEAEAQYVYLPTLALFAASGLQARRSNATALFVAAPFFVLAAEHLRHLAFLIPAVGPGLAAQLEAWPVFARLRPVFARYERDARFAWVFAVLAAALVIGRGIAGTTFDPIARHGLAADIVAIVREENIRGNLYVDRPFAAYLPFEGIGGIKLLIDSHADPYPMDVWEDARELEQLGPDFRGVLARRKLDAVIADRGSPLALGMELLPGWRATTHGDAEAFVRTARPAT